MKKNYLREIPFHPILWGILPLLTFFVANISEVPTSAIWRPLGASVLLALVVYGFYRIIITGWHKSALMASWSLFLFFTYGHLYSILKDVRLLNLLLGRHRLLITLWIVLFVGGVLIIRKIQTLQFWTLFLNVMLMSGILIQGVQIGFYYFNRIFTSIELSSDLSLEYDRSDPLPDIYVIILDAYGRADVLEEYYQFDNSVFMSQLEEFNFMIIPCARGNYEHTVLAIPSLLNMNYMDAFTEEIDEHTSRELLLNNQVRLMLSELGYRFVTYETQYKWLTIEDADLFYDFGSPSRFNFLQPFEVTFLETTGGLIISDLMATKVQSMMSKMNLDSANALKAFVELSNINALEQTIELNSPKLVYAHFMTTHPPFVFDSEGNILNDNEDSEFGYINSTKFINSKIIALVQNIIEKSENEPIIILQSDHGLEPQYRYTILNAIRFPERYGELMIYPGMTPVNSFRVVFNELFSTNYDLLEDRFFESGSGWFDIFEIEMIDPLCKTN